VIAEELGRALAPIPFASTAYFLAEALMLAGSEAQKQAWLPKLAAGETIGCFASVERPGALTEAQVQARVEGGKLSGPSCRSPTATSPMSPWCWRETAADSACSWSSSPAPVWPARRCRRWIPPAASPG